MRQPTLRERIRDYYTRGDWPSTPEGYETPRWKQATGAIIVGVVGFLLAQPLALTAFVLAQSGGSVPAVAAYGLVGIALLGGFASARYVGAPVADHVLNIPREADA
jgi:hypothetical protein